MAVTCNGDVVIGPSQLIDRATILRVRGRRGGDVAVDKRFVDEWMSQFRRHDNNSGINLMVPPADVFGQLMNVIKQRRDHPPERSYTTQLLQGGVAAIGRKIIEEAQEVVGAAGEPDGPEQRQHLIYETGDLLYHLFVLLGHQRIELPEIANELARRFGTSGLDEKATRASGGPSEDSE
jgi:phosphoribosyl-ATP pyrophosphohydrolase